ncbi:hypothetical protein BKA62DRAFT_173853 [Auriculariales sp. MPI-PUGE-AT-0066]|nr:hypothetical protein BKA62DRAFT_173853 [Auriculariales sp. MPI-PUGE-AT-0066]
MCVRNCVLDDEVCVVFSTINAKANQLFRLRAISLTSANARAGFARPFLAYLSVMFVSVRVRLPPGTLREACNYTTQLSQAPERQGYMAVRDDVAVPSVRVFGISESNTEEIDQSPRWQDGMRLSGVGEEQCLLQQDYVYTPHPCNTLCIVPMVPWKHLRIQSRATSSLTNISGPTIRWSGGAVREGYYGSITWPSGHTPAR